MLQRSADGEKTKEMIRGSEGKGKSTEVLREGGGIKGRKINTRKFSGKRGDNATGGEAEGDEDRLCFRV